MRNGEERPGTTRRTVLLAAVGLLAAAPVAGCDDGRTAEMRSPGTDPLNPLHAATATLLARFEATIAAHPGLGERLAPLRDDHRAHLAALAREIGPALASPSTATSTAPDVPTNGDSALTALRDAEKEAGAAALAACLTGPGYRAGLLASIAACRASHVEALS